MELENAVIKFFGGFFSGCKRIFEVLAWIFKNFSKRLDKIFLRYFSEGLFSKRKLDLKHPDVDL